jgi:hypothetical protein
MFSGGEGALTPPVVTKPPQRVANGFVETDTALPECGGDSFQKYAAFLNRKIPSGRIERTHRIEPCAYSR